MKKRFFAFAGIFFCLLFSVFARTVCGRAEESLGNEAVTVVDEAALLMEEEADWLKEIAANLSEKSGWSVIVATCGDAKGKSAQAVCEENFNAYAKGDDGISCLVDMDNHEIYFAVTGKAMRYLSDSKIDAILDEAYAAVSKEDYAQCLYLMLLRAGDAYDAGPAVRMQVISFLGKIFAGMIALAVIVAVFFRGIFKRKKVSGDAAQVQKTRYYRRTPRRNTSYRPPRTRTRSFRGGGRRF